MYRIFTTGIISIVFSAPVYAAYTPVYAGVLLDNNKGVVLLGYQINPSFSIEAQASKSDTKIAQAGTTSITNISSTGLNLLFMFPMKLNGGSTYSLFAKAGYERSNKEVIYNFPASIPNSGTYSNTENRAIFGAGAQYDFYPSLSGRAGIDIVGQERSVYVGAILRF